MLKSLTTKCFRKLEDTHIDYTAGLNVVRAANEGGKTTTIEAIGYAMGGVKACREPLARCVTWGHPEKDLKVTFVLEIEGITYTIKRSKSGAEATYVRGGTEMIVTGQTEVTVFIEKLLGVDVKTMTRLMMASQGGIRGALEEGGAATMTLIETLANFSVVDEVIELVQDKLVTGPPAMTVDRLNRATQAALEARAAIVVPDTDSLKDQANLTKVAHAAALVAADEWSPKLTVARAAVEAALDAFNGRSVLDSQLDAAVRALAGHVTQLAVARLDVKRAPGEVDVLAAQTELATAAGHAAKAATFAQFQQLLKTYPAVNWDEPRATLDAEIITATSAVNHLAVSAATERAEIARLKGEIQTGEGACKSCGQALPNAAAVAAHNVAVNTKLGESTAALTKYTAQQAGARDSLGTLQDIAKAAKPFEDFCAANPLQIILDDTDVPPRLSWSGDEPGPAPDLAGLKDAVAQIRAAATAGVQARAKVELLEASIEADRATIKQVEAAIAAAGEVKNPLDEARAVLGNVEAQYNLHANAVVEHKYALEQLTGQIQSADTIYKQALHSVAGLDAAVEAIQVELLTLEFNNALLKRVKAVRPMISDKLWSIVLATVSAYFSQMRGVQSVVTREGNEFKVDGQSVPGLSGSTLDILGLAIRLALTRTFLPNAPFLILDEPCAAMDDNRAAETLGFLATTGFPQTLLITHESASEAMAQNLITLGEAA